ncbi:hypothetical protein X798_03619 [Onchocerca flexuosa]|nr:hypothetical protein X798_03619 [Onchocerca flexuosa]
MKMVDRSVDAEDNRAARKAVWSTLVSPRKTSSRQGCAKCDTILSSRSPIRTAEDDATDGLFCVGGVRVGRWPN